jgi:hypothetical protein
MKINKSPEGKKGDYHGNKPELPAKGEHHIADREVILGLGFKRYR